MQRLRITTITPGDRFEQPLFSGTGQKLIHAGTPVTQRHLDAIVRASGATVYMADSAEEVLAALNPPAATNAPASDPAAPRRRPVAVDEKRFADDAVQREVDRMLRVAGKTEPRIRRSQPGTPHDRGQRSWMTPEQILDVRRHSVELLAGFFDRTISTAGASAGELDHIICPLLERLRSHPRRFAQLALFDHPRDDYLADHAFTVTVLAMVMADRLGWGNADIRRAGQAGLLLDVGMMLVDARIRQTSGKLSDADLAAMRRHPALSVVALADIRDLDPAILLAAYQHHERENGSGYPQRLEADQIHDLARLLAVADSYAATTQHRRHRRSKLPYVAMEETLRGTAQRTFWPPAVRALVEAAGLFPVGSYVQLSDGRIARVLAANPASLDRPLILPLDRSDAKPLDLARVAKQQLSVQRPVPPPADRSKVGAA